MDAATASGADSQIIQDLSQLCGSQPDAQVLTKVPRFRLTEKQHIKRGRRSVVQYHIVWEGFDAQTDGGWYEEREISRDLPNGALRMDIFDYRGADSNWDPDLTEVPTPWQRQPSQKQQRQQLAQQQGRPQQELQSQPTFGALTQQQAAPSQLSNVAMQLHTQQASPGEFGTAPVSFGAVSSSWQWSQLQTQSAAPSQGQFSMPSSMPQYYTQAGGAPSQAGSPPHMQAPSAAAYAAAPQQQQGDVQERSRLTQAASWQGLQLPWQQQSLPGHLQPPEAHAQRALHQVQYAQPLPGQPHAAGMPQQAQKQQEGFLPQSSQLQGMQGGWYHPPGVQMQQPTVGGYTQQAAPPTATWTGAGPTAAGTGQGGYAGNLGPGQRHPQWTHASEDHSEPARQSVPSDRGAMMLPQQQPASLAQLTWQHQGASVQHQDQQPAYQEQLKVFHRWQHGLPQPSEQAAAQWQPAQVPQRQAEQLHRSAIPQHSGARTSALPASDYPSREDEECAQLLVNSPAGQAAQAQAGPRRYDIPIPFQLPPPADQHAGGGQQQQAQQPMQAQLQPAGAEATFQAAHEQPQQLPTEALFQAEAFDADLGAEVESAETAPTAEVATASDAEVAAGTISDSEGEEEEQQANEAGGLMDVASMLIAKRQQQRAVPASNSQQSGQKTLLGIASQLAARTTQPPPVATGSAPLFPLFNLPLAPHQQQPPQQQRTDRHVTTVPASAAARAATVEARPAATMQAHAQPHAASGTAAPLQQQSSNPQAPAADTANENAYPELHLRVLERRPVPPARPGHQPSISRIFIPTLLAKARSAQFQQDQEQAEQAWARRQAEAARGGKHTAAAQAPLEAQQLFVQRRGGFMSSPVAKQAPPAAAPLIRSPGVGRQLAFGNASAGALPHTLDGQAAARAPQTEHIQQQQQQQPDAATATTDVSTHAQQAAPAERARSPANQRSPLQQLGLASLASGAAALQVSPDRGRRTRGPEEPSIQGPAKRFRSPGNFGNAAPVIDVSTPGRRPVQGTAEFVASTSPATLLAELEASPGLLQRLEEDEFNSADLIAARQTDQGALQIKVRWGDGTSEYVNVKVLERRMWCLLKVYKFLKSKVKAKPRHPAAEAG